MTVRIAADGELQIRTPFGMLGYLDNPSPTAASFQDGYFRTGDLARTRPDSRVELTGRSKDIVSRGGMKIAPLEIDNLLCEHPAVAAALCVGVPDERLGETIHAAIVVHAGRSVDEAGIALVSGVARRAVQNPRCLPFLRCLARRSDRQGGPPRGRGAGAKELESWRQSSSACLS